MKASELEVALNKRMDSRTPEEHQLIDKAATDMLRAQRVIKSIIAEDKK